MVSFLDMASAFYTYSIRIESLLSYFQHLDRATIRERLAVHEGVVDDRLLLGGQRLIELIERGLDLLQPLEAGGEELLAPVDPVEDRSLTAITGRQRGAELALPVRRG